MIIDRFHDRSNKEPERNDAKFRELVELIDAKRFQRNIAAIAASLPDALATMRRLTTVMERAA